MGIPALSDKIVQRAAADILEAIFEQDFIGESYGYRPDKSAKTAVKDLSRELQFGKYNLANIYLHFALDIWFKRVITKKAGSDAYISRYADDFVCAFRYKRDAEKFYEELQTRLKKFGLELSLEKTNIITFCRFKKEESGRFDYLGFEFRWGKSRKGKDTVKRRTSRKKLRKSLKNFTEWCKENNDRHFRNLFEKLNAKLRRYYNYYGLIGNYDSLKEFFAISLDILYKWLNRRSQRKSMDREKFQRDTGLVQYLSASNNREKR